MMMYFHIETHVSAYLRAYILRFLLSLLTALLPHTVGGSLDHGILSVKTMVQGQQNCSITMSCIRGLKERIFMFSLLGCTLLVSSVTQISL